MNDEAVSVSNFFERRSVVLRLVMFMSKFSPAARNHDIAAGVQSAYLLDFRLAISYLSSRLVIVSSESRVGADLNRPAALSIFAVCDLCEPQTKSHEHG